MASHGITTTDFVTFTIHEVATDFQYMVQIGNKGTWSQADVDVTAPVPHASADPLFHENFDFYAGQSITDPLSGKAVAEVTDLDVANGWTGASHSELGADGYGSIPDTSIQDANPGGRDRHLAHVH